MKEKVYILGEILNETQARYPHINIRKFVTLFFGWRQQGLRNKVRSTTFYTDAWRRGWLSKKDADDLRKYIGIL